MLTINVAPDGSGQFTTISEAVLAVPYDCPAVIRIAPGIYREKLVCEKKDITLAGAGMDATRLVWNDGGKLPHPDGRPTHTFRSYTAFFSGEKLRVEDMTIENDAGPGAKAGQAVAAYVDSARAAFDRVRLLGNQDTLFCAPLPEKEREKDGFLGPRGLAPRRASAQYYHACEIAGDIDLSLAGQTPCLSTAPCARWTTALRTAGSPHPPVRRMGWALCSGTATLCRIAARRAPCIWGGPGGPPGKRRCWPAVWGPTLPRRALRAGTTAPTRTLPGLPRPATLAQGPARAGRGCRHWTKHRPGRCCALPAGGAARNNNKKRTYI